MRIPRIHVVQPLAPGRDVTLSAQAGEHIVRVLRLEPGHPLRLFNGDGSEYAAQLATVTKREVTVRVLDVAVQADRESPLRITLGQGIARGEKMDLILQKATELGVARLVPLVTRRTEVKLDRDSAERRIAHWRAVVAAACEQCGRSRLPEVREPLNLQDWIAGLDEAAGLRLVLDPHGQVSPRSVTAVARMTLVAGPEGGLAPPDMEALDAAGFRGLRLGPRILRTETAGLAALAALQAIHGDL